MHFVCVYCDGDVHLLCDFIVFVALVGDFDVVHLIGDNINVLFMDM